MTERDELIAQAEAAGVQIDKRWGNDRIAQAIAGTQGAPESAAPSEAPNTAKEAKRLPVKLLRNYCPHGGVKQAAGAEIELPRDEAVHVVNVGIAVRNDAFGG